MRLIKLKRFTQEVESLPEYRDSFRAMKAHLMKHTKTGVPLNIITVMHELEKHELFEFNGYHYTILVLLLDHLSEKHGWRLCKMPIFFCIRDRTNEPSLSDFIDLMVTPNVSFDLPGRLRTIKKLTGEEIKQDTLRKVVERLIKSGRFSKIERGKYKRTHIGY